MKSGVLNAVWISPSFGYPSFDQFSTIVMAVVTEHSFLLKVESSGKNLDLLCTQGMIIYFKFF
jgi:hypothetical protein